MNEDKRRAYLTGHTVLLIAAFLAIFTTLITQGTPPYRDWAALVLAIAAISGFIGLIGLVLCFDSQIWDDS